MENVSVTITKNDVANFFEKDYDASQDLRFENVAKLSIGGRLIWVEYFEGENRRYRAYGRYEFNNVIVQTETDFSVFPVSDSNFKELHTLFE